MISISLFPKPQMHLTTSISLSVSESLNFYISHVRRCRICFLYLAYFIHQSVLQVTSSNILHGTQGLRLIPWHSQFAQRSLIDHGPKQEACWVMNRDFAWIVHQLVPPQIFTFIDILKPGGEGCGVPHQGLESET